MLLANFLVAQQVRVVVFGFKESGDTVVVWYGRGRQVTEPDYTSCPCVLRSYGL